MMLRKIKKVNIPAISRSWILEESPRGDLWDQRCTENHNDHSAMITLQCQWSLYNGHSATFTSYTLHWVKTIPYWTPAEFLFQLTWLSHCLLYKRIKGYRSHLRLAYILYCHHHHWMYEFAIGRVHVVDENEDEEGFEESSSVRIWLLISLNDVQPAREREKMEL